MYQGYIKLYRSSQDNILYFSEPFTKRQAWQDMILLANHKPGVLIVRGICVDVDRGQLGQSEETLAGRWKWSRGKVRRFLNYLESIQQIVQHKSKVKSTITIMNYDKFQGSGTTDSTTDGQQTVQQTDTNNNDKNKKNENKIYKTIKRGRGKSNLEITIEDNQKLLDQGRTQEILDSQYDAIENYSKNGKYTSLYLTTLQRLKKVEKPKPKHTITEDDDIYSLMA